MYKYDSSRKRRVNSINLCLLIKFPHFKNIMITSAVILIALLGMAAADEGSLTADRQISPIVTTHCCYSSVNACNQMCYNDKQQCGRCTRQIYPYTVDCKISNGLYNCTTTGDFTTNGTYWGQFDCQCYDYGKPLNDVNDCPHIRALPNNAFHETEIPENEDPQSANCMAQPCGSSDTVGPIQSTTCWGSSIVACHQVCFQDQKRCGRCIHESYDCLVDCTDNESASTCTARANLNTKGPAWGQFLCQCDGVPANDVEADCPYYQPLPNHHYKVRPLVKEVVQACGKIALEQVVLAPGY